MTKKIIFYPLYENLLETDKPKPAKSCIPEWYKEQESYLNNKKTIFHNGQTNATVKKCIPVFDLLTSGYIIFTSVDISVSKKDNDPMYFTWSNTFQNKLDSKKDNPPVGFQPGWQTSNYSKLNKQEYIPKFVNPWSIITPSGYSTLIINPGYRDLPFEIVPAIVDTDKYNYEINFPFYFKEDGWEGIIEAGTPIAQVIPFKRDNWEMNIKDTPNILKSIKTQNDILNSNFFDRYKKYFWNRKSFK